MRKLLLVCVLVCAVGPYVFARQRPVKKVPPGSDCIPYNPADLRITDDGGGRWKLERADGAQFRSFADREDAEAGLAVFKQHSALCYIGRDSGITGPYRLQYVMEYLK